MPYKQSYIKINLAFQIDNLELYVILEYKFTTIIEFKLGFKTKKNRNQKRRKRWRKLDWALILISAHQEPPPLRPNSPFNDMVAPLHNIPLSCAAFLNSAYRRAQSGSPRAVPSSYPGVSVTRSQSSVRTVDLLPKQLHRVLWWQRRLHNRIPCARADLRRSIKPHHAPLLHLA
jgi:hypothetical protein